MAKKDPESTSPRAQSKRGVILAILAAAVIIGAGLAIGLAIGLRSRNTDSKDDVIEPEMFKSGYGKYRFATVVADAEICSTMGTQVMARQRGNVVDATVATVICDGVVNTHSAGIGGGAFFIYYDRQKRQAIAFDARETAPAAATEDMYVAEPSLSLLGGKAIGIPGELKGLWTLHQRYGTVPWADLLQPTIDLCDQGIPLTVSQHNAAIIEMKNIKNNSQFQFLFDGDGNLLPIGTKIKRPALRKTLKAIADQGPDAFYNGSLTDDIVADITDAGGIITRQDLENYRVEVEEPIIFNLSTQLTFYSMPPPGSGAVLAYILNILSGYKFQADSISENKAVLTYHRIAEAMKFAFAKRTELGDIRFLNLTQLLANMTSAEVGEEIRSKIDDAKTHDTAYYGPTFYDVVKTGTAHFSLMDSQGNVVSVTSTINTRFGSKVKGNRTGIIFNNEMDDFATPNTTNYFNVPASPANFIRPGKRPLSSMSPTVIVDSSTGDVRMVVGGAGGTRITTGTAMVTMNTLWFNMSLLAAVDAPRMHHQLLPPEVNLENGFPKYVVEGLRKKGHTIGKEKKSIVTAIHRTKDDMLDAVSDYRKLGKPDGY